MLSYELAKKLKESGFSQEKRAGGYFMSSGEIKDKTYNPTLSELIDACGDKFIALRKGDKSAVKGREWNCWGNDEDSKKIFHNCTWARDTNIYGHGETPESAVASLWLKLHEKK